MFIIDSNEKIKYRTAKENSNQHALFLPYATTISFNEMVANLDYVLFQNNGKKASYISSVININDTPLYILTSISYSHSFHASDIPLLFLLSDTLANYLALHATSKRLIQPVLTRNLLFSLITNQIEDKEVMLERAHDLNLKFNKYNYLLILFNNEKKQICKNDILSQHIRITSRTNYPSCISANHIVLLVSNKNEINDIIGRVSGIDSNYLMNEPLNSMMVSLSFSDITKVYSTYTQCTSIINTLYGIKPGSLLYQENYLYHYSINQIIYTNKKNNFSIPKAEQILQYDEEHATDYAITILIYLYHYMKINDAALALNIHKNSLAYRIRRSTELFDIDYSDYPALNALQLSLEILLYKLPEL